MKRSQLVFAQAIAVVALAAFVMANPAHAQFDSRGTSVAKSPDAAAFVHAESLSRAFRYASSKVLPAVVKISSRTAARRVRVSEPNGIEDFFFGGDRYIPESGGTGSGVIISANGVILTNNHVVSGADTVMVRLEDGTEFEAVDIRTDPDSDLAVLRIKTDRKLPFASMGDSDQLEIGDWVLAIGHPFDLESSVSAGIVSAKGRSLGAAARATYLQTDAAVNPGNSGGPLINLRGEIVGINTAIASRSGGFNGISFAIPVNLAKWVSTQLVRDGEVRRAWLGVGVSKVTPVIRTVSRLDSGTNGVWVGEVHRNTPSERGGIQPGDVITQVSGTPVSDLSQLQRVVEKAPLDSEIALDVVRNGRPLQLKIQATTMPKNIGEGGPTRIRGIKQDEIVRVNPFGLGEMYMYQVDSSIADQLGTTESGILILESSSQAAFNKGLTNGAVINKINGRQVTSFDEFVKAIEAVGVDKPLVINIEVPGQSKKIIVLDPIG
jgi:serine protease Do